MKLSVGINKSSRYLKQKAMAILKNIKRELILLREKSLYVVPELQGGFFGPSAGRSSLQTMILYHWITHSWAGSLTFARGKAKLHVVSYVQTFQATELASSQRAKLPLMASHIYEPTGHIFTLTYLLATVISTWECSCIMLLWMPWRMTVIEK